MNTDLTISVRAVADSINDTMVALNGCSGSPAMEESRAGDAIILLLGTLCISTQVPQLRDAAIPYIQKQRQRALRLESWRNGKAVIELSGCAP